MIDRDPTHRALSRLIWPLRLTRFGLFAERVTRGFWPVWSILFVAFAAFAFGAPEALPLELLWAGLALLAGGLVWSIWRGLSQFQMPTHAEALDRLDRTMAGRPITALIDAPAIGGDDPATRSVWEAHLARMAEKVREARAPAPDLKISDRDPYGLRFVAATAFAMALLFGVAGRVQDMDDMLVTPGQAVASGPSWEGWIEPPLYTGLPSLYLNDITRESFEAPLGSRVSIRLYGEVGSLSLRQSVSDATSDAAPDAPSQDFTLDQSGEIAIDGPNGRAWQISILADQPPAIVMVGELEGIPPGQMGLTFTATDDFGIATARVEIALDPANADRRHGLAIDPEPREALVLDLPLPFNGSRAEFTEILVEDLSEHPFANLPVTITLSATDDAGQMGQSSEAIARLPGRRFFDPVANALIEQRRDLLWSRENAGRTAQILRAVTHRPEGAFDDEGAYLMVRSAIRRLESGVDSISGTLRDEVAELLWNAAIELEEGDLSDALERLRRAQDRLSEAMRQGASDEEIAQLMDELREAMDDYMRQLAQNAEPQDTDERDQSGETMEMSMNDIDEMLRRIEELMQQGRMAEAQEMLDALRQMMENMQITQGEGGEGPQSPGQEAMEGLQDTLRGQQGLSDESFQDLQDQFNPGRPGQQGQQSQQGQQQGQQPGQQGGQPQGQGQQGEPQQGQNGQGQGSQPSPLDGDNQGEGAGGENDGRSLAERQRDLRRQLQEQAQNLPGTNSEEGREAQDMLDQAGRAMDEAAEALERGDLADALDNQSEAMEALREGMGQLGEALAQDQSGEEPGQGQAQGDMAPSQPMQDPLGRAAGNAGSLGTEEDFERREEAFRRARDLMDELRRRSAEQERPDVELEYLRRLLDRF
ncbi:TIGR02302 family protein [Rhodophyticola sp. SM2404]